MGKTRPVEEGGTANPARRFLLVFAIAFALLESIVRFLLYDHAVFAPYGAMNAKACAWILGHFYDGVSANGTLLSLPGFSIDIRPGCDSFQASAVLLAGILAFPATWKERGVGAIVGLVFLFVLNLVRLCTMLLVGLHHRSLFDTIHLEVAPIVFIIAALFAWVAWAYWVGRPQALGRETG